MGSHVGCAAAHSAANGPTDQRAVSVAHVAAIAVAHAAADAAADAHADVAPDAAAHAAANVGADARADVGAHALPDAAANADAVACAEPAAEPGAVAADNERAEPCADAPVRTSTPTPTPSADTGPDAPSRRTCWRLCPQCYRHSIGPTHEPTTEQEGESAAGLARATVAAWAPGLVGALAAGSA